MVVNPSDAVFEEVDSKPIEKESIGLIDLNSITSSDMSLDLRKRGIMLWEQMEKTAESPPPSDDGSVRRMSPVRSPVAAPIIHETEKVPVMGLASNTEELASLKARQDRIRKLCDEGMLYLHTNEDDLIIGYTLSPTQRRRKQQQVEQRAAYVSPKAPTPDPEPHRVILHLSDPPPPACAVRSSTPSPKHDSVRRVISPSQVISPVAERVVPAEEDEEDSFSEPLLSPIPEKITAAEPEDDSLNESPLMLNSSNTEILSENPIHALSLELSTQKQEHRLAFEQSRRDNNLLHGEIQRQNELRLSESVRQEKFLETLQKQQDMLRKEVNHHKEERKKTQDSREKSLRESQRLQYAQLQELMADQQQQLFDVVKQLQERHLSRETSNEEWAARLQDQLMRQQQQLVNQLSLLKELHKKQVGDSPQTISISPARSANSHANQNLQRQVEDQLSFLQELKEESILKTHPTNLLQERLPSSSPPHSTVEDDYVNRLIGIETQHSCKHSHCSCHITHKNQAPCIGVSLLKGRVPSQSPTRSPLVSPQPSDSISNVGGRNPHVWKNFDKENVWSSGYANPRSREETPTKQSVDIWRTPNKKMKDLNVNTHTTTNPHSTIPTYQSLYRHRQELRRCGASKSSQNSESIPGSGYLLKSPLPIPSTYVNVSPVRPKLVSTSVHPIAGSSSSISPPPLNVSPHRISLSLDHEMLYQLRSES